MEAGTVLFCCLRVSGRIPYQSVDKLPGQIIRSPSFKRKTDTLFQSLSRDPCPVIKRDLLASTGPRLPFSGEVDGQPDRDYGKSVVGGSLVTGLVPKREGME
jgi:hypothetical protein